VRLAQLRPGRLSSAGFLVASKATPGHLGPYRLLSVVHTSPIGRLWQAYHEGLGQTFALKTLLEQYAGDREKVGYLKWEYAVGERLVHPRVIRVHEFAMDRQGPYLAMEWFAAPNLKHRIQQGIEAIAPLIPKIVLQAAEALAYFNSQGWVHRDVKPENFLVNDEGDVKLIDFALAQRRRTGLLRLFAPKARRVQGTCSYISPEQIRGWPLDERADLYGLACTFFELCAGKPPFAGATVNELLTKHLRSPPPRLDTVNECVSCEFGELIRQAMAKDPANRPASTQEFLRQLQGVRIWRRMPNTPQAAKKAEAP